MGRVVITGIGAWSCLGNSLDEIRDSLFKGKSGIVIDPLRKDWGYRSCLTGKVDQAQLKGCFERPRIDDGADELIHAQIRGDFGRRGCDGIVHHIAAPE